MYRLATISPHRATGMTWEQGTGTIAQRMHHHRHTPQKRPAAVVGLLTQGSTGPPAGLHDVDQGRGLVRVPSLLRRDEIGELCHTWVGENVL